MLASTRAAAQIGPMDEGPKPSATGSAPAGPVHLRVPEGDDRTRYVCLDCGFVNYLNPRIVVGSVCTWTEGGDARFLMCRRAIEPRRGFWTIPAGYLEHGESAEEGARREALEEANADIRIDALLAVYSIRRIGQVQLIYRATLASPEVPPGPESLETALVAWDDVPWDDLAFPTVGWALRHHRAVAGQAVFAPFGNPEEAG